MRRVLALALLLSVTLLVRPDAAMGSGLPWPVSGEVVLGYGDAYGASGSTRVHRGVDVAAAAGSSVRSPASAVVAFAGRVPADEGASRLAVSLDLPDGLRVTLTPLAELAVTAGQQVATGDVVGCLAATADPSYDRPHLHVGLRRQDVYLDPAILFGTEAGIPEPAPRPPAPTPPDVTVRLPEIPRPPGAAPVAEVPHAAPAAVSPPAVPAVSPRDLVPQADGADRAAEPAVEPGPGVHSSALARGGANRIDARVVASLASCAAIGAFSVGALRRRLAVGRA